MWMIRGTSAAASRSITSRPAPDRGGSSTATSARRDWAASARRTESVTTETLPRSASAARADREAPRDVSTLTTCPPSPTASPSTAAKIPAPPYRSHATIPSRSCAHSATNSLYTRAASRWACQNAVTGTRHTRSLTRCVAS